MPILEALTFDEKIKVFLDTLYGIYIKAGDNFGQISRNEAEFIIQRVRHKKPQLVLEIGVASGASSASILTCLEADANPATLVALDCLEHCYFAPQKPVGFIVPQALGGVPASYELYTGVSSLELERVMKGRKADFVFIDGNHSHPWACIDTILTLPFIAPGAQVVYHDINLHFLGGETKALSKGPHQLFYTIAAYDKITIGEFPYPNIGGLTLSADQTANLCAIMAPMFSFPWEADAWPALDGDIILQLARFIGDHWGNTMKAFFLSEARKRLP